MATAYEEQARLFQRWQWAMMAANDDSDDEGYGRTRPQPESTAILARFDPGCERYFKRGACHDLFMVWCPGFFTRFICCNWVDWRETEYARRCYETSAEGIAEKALADAASAAAAADPWQFS